MSKLKLVNVDGDNAIFSTDDGKLISFPLDEKPKLKLQISMKEHMKRADGSEADFYINGYFDSEGFFVVINSEFDNAML